MNAETLRARIVEAHDEVRRGAPGAQRKLERLQAEFRTSGALIERPGGSVRVVEAGSANGSSRVGTIERTSTLTKRRPATQRPKWQLGPDPLSYKEVELRDRGYVDYRVSLGSSARKDILSEIDRAHQAAGEAVEAAGWLFSQYRPRADHNSTSIALVTRSIERSGTRGEVYLI